MAILNKRASEIMLYVGVSTATDITGFGLLGHMYEVLPASKVQVNDAQTSGGLLIFVPGNKKDKLVTALQKENILAAYIGDVLSESKEDNKRIFVD